MCTRLLPRTQSQRSEGQRSTYKNRRRAADAPAVAEPKAVPAPPTAAPVEAQHAAVTVRVAKDGTVEEDEGGLSVRILFPSLRDEVLVLPQRLKDASVKPHKTGILQTRELLLALDPFFSGLEHMLEPDRVEIDLGDSQALFVLFCDAPSSTEDLGRVELLAAVDRDDVAHVLLLASRLSVSVSLGDQPYIRQKLPRLALSGGGMTK